MTSGLLILAIVSALASALLLALSQQRNWGITYGARAGRRTTMRRIGWPLALLTLALCIVRDGASFGPILGLFLLAVAFAVAALMLAFCPRWLRPVALLFATDSARSPIDVADRSQRDASLTANFSGSLIKTLWRPPSDAAKPRCRGIRRWIRP